QVACDVDVGDVVDVRREVAGADTVEVADEAHQIVPRGARLVARDVELRAVAGGQDDGLARRSPAGERAKRLGHASGLEIDPLAQFDRRGAMTDSDQEKLHQPSWSRVLGPSF